LQQQLHVVERVLEVVGDGRGDHPDRLAALGSGEPFREDAGGRPLRLVQALVPLRNEERGRDERASEGRRGPVHDDRDGPDGTGPLERRDDVVDPRQEKAEEEPGDDGQRGPGAAIHERAGYRTCDGVANPVVRQTTTRLVFAETSSRAILFDSYHLWGEGPRGWRGSRAVLSRLLAAFAALTVLAPLPARAKSDKSRVVQKALLESVRVEVTVAGKVARAATGVVVANDAGSSFILTNEHVVSRDGLKGTPSYTVVVERPALRRIPAR